MQKLSHKKAGESKTSEKKTVLQVLEPAELMRFLMEKMPHQSRNNIKALLTHGQILVDNKPVSQYNHLLNIGQEVLVNWSLVRSKEAEEGLKIIFEDTDIIIIDKPAGLLTIASETENEQTAYRQLVNHVREKNPENRIFIVHRLDRDTSGVMLFAKNEEIKRTLQDGWKEIMVERAYVAVVEGQIRKKEGTIKSWLQETKTKLMHSSSSPGEGLEAITHYEVLQYVANYSLLKIHLETGRKNQIRVQMQDIGHSIAGDKKYGAKTNPIGRVALHAQILAFCHPKTKELLRFATEIPPAFMRILR